MKTFSIILICFIFSTLLAGVNIGVPNGIKVEAGNNITVFIDGDITENGTGYFSGKISSGLRSGLTSFAGLTISNGMDGTITRITGTAYAKGNGEGTNFKRYYELNNTGSGTVTADLQIECILSGNNDESNGLAGPFFIYRYVSSWTGYGDGSSASPVSTGSAQIPTGISDWVISEGCRLSAKILLEGPYNESTDQMTTAINSNLPLTSPYPEDARTVSAVPTGITDWVLVQVRNTANGSELAARSCFLKADGLLVADDGSTNYIGIKIAPGDYYLVIKHRNHLAVMTAAAQTGLTWGVTPPTYDFSTGSAQFYGTGGAKELESGVWGMWAGDINQDGEVTTSDYTIWYNSARVGDSGYKNTDCNFDTQVTTSDYTIWYNNARIGASSTVP